MFWKKKPKVQYKTEYFECPDDRKEEFLKLLQEMDRDVKELTSYRFWNFVDKLFTSAYPEFDINLYMDVKFINHINFGIETQEVINETNSVDP